MPQSLRLAVLFVLTLSASAALAQFKVGLVLDKGGKDDKSFNSAAFAGATRAEKELGIEFKYVEASDLNALENFHRSFARKKFDLIIGVGFAQTDAVRKIAAQFPNQKFAIVDGEVNAANVKSLMFEEHEGSYLVGALAALSSKTGKIGFIGGMDIPLIRRFEAGFSAGVKKVNPKAKVSMNYIGVTGDAWNNPTKAKELALAQISSGVDVIFVAAGASGSGAFDAAASQKKFVIGVDSNQNWMKPGTVLTSMLKRVDVAVFDSIRETQATQFKAGTARFGLGNKGVDYAVDEHNEKLITPDMKAKLETLRSEILAGKIKVPDYYKTRQ